LAGSDDDDDDDDEYGDGHSGVEGSDEGSSYYMPFELDLDDSNSVYVGLRVYTHKDVPVEIESRLG